MRTSCRRGALSIFQGFCLVAQLAFWTGPARAAELDIQRWLDEPGVKLVAVEFYAKWCEPCMKAVPRWEALRKKYHDDGLRLLVVNYNPKTPGCPTLKWRPDDNICDLRGQIGDAFGFESLPAAYLWSWQGNLLVQHGHIEEVEREIKRYLHKNPRVKVQATDDKGREDKKLQDRFNAELGKQGKLTVVPDAVMVKSLRKTRDESYKAQRREDQQCTLGEEISANSILQVKRYKDELSVQLFDAEKGCQRAGAFSPWKATQSERSVSAAVYKLLRALRQKASMPGDSTPPPQADSDKPQEATGHGGEPSPRAIADDSGETKGRVPESPPDIPKPWSVAKTVGYELIRVEAGAFIMGSSAELAKCKNPKDCETPHQVTITRPYYIGVTEVTQEQWRPLMGSNPSRFVGDNSPVEGITWFDAVRFANELSRREGLNPAYRVSGEHVTWNREADGYRLPTEAEWEMAARGGRTAAFSGSDSAEEVGWFKKNSKRPQPVKGKRPNGFGVYDMTGNVWEWVWDWNAAYPSSAETDPTGPAHGTERVFRGGAWAEARDKNRVANRGCYYPEKSGWRKALNRLGLRLARNAQ